MVLEQGLLVEIVRVQSPQQLEGEDVSFSNQIKDFWLKP
jgi:hypothetical protein